MIWITSGSSSTRQSSTHLDKKLDNEIHDCGCGRHVSRVGNSQRRGISMSTPWIAFWLPPTAGQGRRTWRVEFIVERFSEANLKKKGDQKPDRALDPSRVVMLTDSRPIQWLPSDLKDAYLGFTTLGPAISRSFHCVFTQSHVEIFGPSHAPKCHFYADKWLALAMIVAVSLATASWRPIMSTVDRM